MTLENYGSVWQIDHCLAVASFHLLDENDMKKCFNWVNLRPMYVKENIIKGDKINIRLILSITSKTGILFHEVKCPRRILLKLLLMKFIVKHQRKIILLIN